MIEAAGGLVWRISAKGALQVVVVHRPRYDDWSLPKGKLDPGESRPFAAVRETAEETGFTAALRSCLGDVQYDVPEGPKQVRYWSAEAVGGAYTANEETDELRWCAPGDAAGLVSYRRDLDVLNRFADVGVPDSTVLLVRHAKAGSRTQWTTDDDLRPLSGTGHEQARHLAALLPLFGPDRVATAPPVRCRVTVAPLAAVLDLAVTVEPLLGEEGYWADPAKGLLRLRELAAAPGVTVICSQGGVIPDVVAGLTDRDDVPARKASTWVLTFRDGTPITADYYPRPTD